MTTEVPPPKELSRLALSRIVENPHTWDQNHWHCGTTHCYAGHVDLVIHDYFQDPNFLNEDLVGGLYYDVIGYLDLKGTEFNLLSHCDNNLDELIQYHNIFYKDSFQT